MTQKRSRYTAQLEKLGFKALSPEDEAYLEERLRQRLEERGIFMHMLTRQQRRLVQNTLKKPRFLVTITDGRSFTYVTDNLGKGWSIAEAIDPKVLVAMGFENDAQHVPSVLLFPPLGPLRKHS